MKSCTRLLTVLIFSNVLNWSLLSSSAFSQYLSNDFMAYDRSTEPSSPDPIERLEDEVKDLRRSVHSLENDGRIYTSKMGVVRVEYPSTTYDDRMATRRLTPQEVADRIRRANNRIYELEREISQRRNSSIELPKRFEYEAEAKDIGYKLKPNAGQSNDSHSMSLESILHTGPRNAKAARAVQKFAQIMVNLKAKEFNIARISDPRSWSYANGVWYFQAPPILNIPWSPYSWEQVRRTINEQFNLQLDKIPARLNSLRCERVL